MNGYLDGNGRVGRMLVPLFLFEQKLLHTPMFYMSEYLDEHREEYYDQRECGGQRRLRGSRDSQFR